MFITKIKPGQRLVIGKDITIKIEKISQGRVKLAIDLPREIKISLPDMQQKKVCKMIFHCLKCSEEFTLDECDEVKCPFCGSENVYSYEV